MEKLSPANIRRAILRLTRWIPPRQKLIRCIAPRISSPPALGGPLSPFRMTAEFPQLFVARFPLHRKFGPGPSGIGNKLRSATRASPPPGVRQKASIGNPIRMTFRAGSSILRISIHRKNIRWSSKFTVARVLPCFPLGPAAAISLSRWLRLDILS